MTLIKQPNDVMPELHLRGLLYGQPGIGKSTTAISAPNPVLIDCDNGVHRIHVSHRVPYLPVKNYQEVLDVIGSKDIAPFDTIVFDTAGKLLDYMAMWIIQNDPKMGRKDGALSLQGYGRRKYEFISQLKRVSTMGKHIVFVAHELEERNGDDGKVIRPEVGGSSGGDLIKELDWVGYMEASGKKRTISFTPCDRYYAKNSARLDDVIHVPELAKGDKNAFLSGIISQCLASMNAENEMQGQYDALVADNEKTIGKCQNADALNAVMMALGSQTPIWDSKERAWATLKARAAELGAAWDGKAKTFSGKEVA